MINKSYIVVVVSIAFLSVVRLSVQGLSLCISPLALFVKTLTTSLCSALLFFSFCFLFLHLPRARSVALSPLSVCPSVCLWLRSDSYKKVAFHEEQIQGQRQGQGHLPALHV